MIFMKLKLFLHLAKTQRIYKDGTPVSFMNLPIIKIKMSKSIYYDGDCNNIPKLSLWYVHM